MQKNRQVGSRQCQDALFPFSGLGVGYYLFGAIRAIIDYQAAEEIISINGDGDPTTTDSSLPDLQEPILS